MLKESPQFVDFNKVPVDMFTNHELARMLQNYQGDFNSNNLDVLLDFLKNQFHTYINLIILNSSASQNKRLKLIDHVKIKMRFSSSCTENIDDALKYKLIKVCSDIFRIQATFPHGGRSLKALSDNYLELSHAKVEHLTQLE